MLPRNTLRLLQRPLARSVPQSRAILPTRRALPAFATPLASRFFAAPAVSSSVSAPATAVTAPGASSAAESCSRPHATAYCTNLSYRLKSLEKFFPQGQMQGKKLTNYLYVHQPGGSHFPADSEAVFFPSGTFVLWNTTPAQEEIILSHIRSLSPAEAPLLALEPIHTVEKDTYYWTLNTALPTTSIAHDESSSSDIITLNDDDMETKIAISYALAASVKLSIAESANEKVLDLVTEIMSKKSLSQKHYVLAYRNVLLNINRSNMQINSGPEYFWEHPTKEPIYDRISRYLEVKNRGTHVSQTLDYTQSLIQSLLDDSKHSHSVRLERIIILLIMVEVFFACIDHFPSEYLPAWAIKLMSKKVSVVDIPAHEEGELEADAV